MLGYKPTRRQVNSSSHIAATFECVYSSTSYYLWLFADTNGPGLSAAEAESRLQKYGPNIIQGESGPRIGRILLRFVWLKTIYNPVNM